MAGEIRLRETNWNDSMVYTYNVLVTTGPSKTAAN
jgi:hypothetical protein